MAEHYDLQQERDQRFLRGGPPGGETFDDRLRELEIAMAKVTTEVKNIEKNMASSKDISDLKAWILGGVLSAIAVAATIAAVVVKAFF